MNIDAIKTQVVGKWHGIFNSLGIDVGDGKHKDCPLCGGRDRFRFDDKEGNGTWICNQCGAGDGWAMMMNKLGLQFVDAAKEVGGLLGTVERFNKPKEPQMTAEKMRSIFLESKPVVEGDPVSIYLKSRGLSKISTALRYHPRCWEPETKKYQKAMLAIFTGTDDVALTMHRTYLNSDSEKLEINSPKKILPGLGKLSGGAVRLFPLDGEVLGIAEGIETAIAATEDLNIPVWAALTANLLEKFIPPQSVRSLVVIGDNDKNFTGQKSAYTLANKIVVREKIDSKVYLPLRTGTDWLDEYRSNLTAN